MVIMVKNQSLLLMFFFLVLIGSFYFVQAIGLMESNQWGWNLTAVSYASIAIGDLNGDNKTDIILTGRSAVTPYAKVYINNGTSLGEENNTWQWNLTGVYDSSLALGDIDNDGDLDLAVLNGKVYINNGTSLEESQQWQWNLTSSTSSTVLLGDVNNDGRLDLLSGSPEFKIYINNGTSFNDNINWAKNVIASLSLGISSGVVESMDLGDYDNDGDLDLVECGHDGGDPRNKLFKNNGTSFVLDIDELTDGLNDCDVSFGDIDNDGDLDLVEHGAFFTQLEAYLFINENGSFIANGTWKGELASTRYGSLAFGDYNNDGKLDILWTGNYISKVYNNTGTNFAEDSIFESNLTGVTYSAVGWADLDNDNDLDAIVAGYCGAAGTCFVGNSYISNASLYKNNSFPYPPSSFQNYSLANGNLFLGWNSGSDNETISTGLYYNLRVGTTSSGNQIVSGVLGNGGRGGDGGGQNGQFGNMMQRRNISLSGSRFQVGTTYYWSVQTIDTGLAKSAWSAEQTFTLTSDFTPPVVTLNAPSGVTNQTLNIVFNATIYDDYNLTNVSLYGNWSGWHINQTNSSGINNTDYIFKANLTEGNWLWGIRACDATSNCRGSNSTFRIDITYPIVNLVSPANGTSQTSSNSVTFTYNVSDVAINNCTLYLNGAANETDTSITSNGSSQSFTENVPNGNYNWTIRCADAANNINTSGNYNLTISYTPTETPASTSGGGGSGGGGGSTTSATPKVSRVTMIGEGLNVIDFTETEKASVGVEEILIESSARADYAKVSVEKLAGIPADIPLVPSPNTYSYLKIEKTILKNEDLKNAKITFTVSKKWVSDNDYNPEKVVLQRYTTDWNKLPTAYLKQDASNYYYQSSSPGFSVFAITAEKKQAEPAKEENVTKQENITKEPPLPIEVPKAPEEPRQRLISYVFLVLIAVAIIAVIIIVRLKSKRRWKK